MLQTLDPRKLSGWGIYEIACLQDPYPVWDQLRTEQPVLDAGDGVFLVTSWELVDRAARDPTLLAGRGVAESMDTQATSTIDVASLWLMALDGSRHVRARGLVRRPFSARRIEALRPLVEEQVNKRLAPFLEECRAAPTDFVRRVALALPSEITRSLFQIDEQVWAREVHARFQPQEGPSSSTTIQELTRFFDTAEVPTGLFHDLTEPDEDGNRLTREEVLANAVLLTMAAIDTTTGLIANALLCLLQNPDVLAQAEADPSLAAAVVEETLRYEPPALSFSRYAPHDFVLGEVAIPAGSHLGAANRDPGRYRDPGRFRLDRDQSGLLTFGGGRHFCLGASLARMEARVVLEALLGHGLSFQLEKAVVWRNDNPTVRVPASLLVSLREEAKA